MSLWWLILYGFIPTAVVLLLIIHFAHGTLQRLNDATMWVVGRIMFAQFNVLPLPLCTAIIIFHIILAVTQATTVYNYSVNQLAPTKLSPLDVQITYQAKEFRAQRNLYLTCLSLALWWFLYSVYSLKTQLDNATRVRVVTVDERKID